jgi:hypothetical protein
MNPNPPLYLLKVAFRGIKPPIWRRICVRADSTFGDLHEVLLSIMEWSDFHLHLFNLYGHELSDGRLFEEDDDGIGDESKFRLNVYTQTGSIFYYKYDFGDDWVLKITVLDDDYKYHDEFFEPYEIIAGKRAAPPEDCGGVYGYYRLLEVLKDPNHPSYEDCRELAGDDWEPDAI